MYNKKILEKIDEQIQEELDAVLEKWTPKIEEAINGQLMNGDKMNVGMGTAVIYTDKVDSKAEEFAGQVASYQWKDKFRTSISLDYYREKQNQ